MSHFLSDPDAKLITQIVHAVPVGVLLVHHSMQIALHNHTLADWNSN